MIALDRSSGLLSHARKMGFGGLNANRQEDDREETGDGNQVAECVRGDMGIDAWRAGVFDFVISIAALHHLSTPERRQHAVQVSLPVLPLQPRDTDQIHRSCSDRFAYQVSHRTEGS